jgi:hypothetical protein
LSAGKMTVTKLASMLVAMQKTLGVTQIFTRRGPNPVPKV